MPVQGTNAHLINIRAVCKHVHLSQPCAHSNQNCCPLRSLHTRSFASCSWWSLQSVRAPAAGSRIVRVSASIQQSIAHQHHPMQVRLSTMPGSTLPHDRCPQLLVHLNFEFDQVAPQDASCCGGPVRPTTANIMCSAC